jgi:hypothetical protein
MLAPAPPLRNYERGWASVDTRAVPESYRHHVRRDEIMPIFQAGPATDAEVKNSLQLFGTYVIPRFKTTERQAQTAAASPTVHG